MERRVRERLIGALVLVALVVLLVPSVLRGRDPAPQSEVESAQAASRRVVVPAIADEDPLPDVLVPEPVAIAETRAPPAAAVEPGRTRRAEPEPPPAPRAASPDPAPARSRPETPAWAVQLGAFASRDTAEALVARLRQRGYAAFVLEYRASGKVLYRVRVGPEQERARADAIAARLAKDGFQTVVARHP